MTTTARQSMAELIARIAETLERAKQSEPDVPEAMALATADARGNPSVRMVLLRGLDERGLVFYTNFESTKAHELGANPRAAVCLHFKSLREQIRVQGSVERVDDAQSDAYFASRPRANQLGAWASPQSERMPSRAQLVERYAEFERQYADGEIPRPPFWGGYRVVPSQIEFWRHEESRLHHRELFERDGEDWHMTLLNP